MGNNNFFSDNDPVMKFYSAIVKRQFDVAKEILGKGELQLNTRHVKDVASHNDAEGLDFVLQQVPTKQKQEFVFEAMVTAVERGAVAALEILVNNHNLKVTPGMLQLSMKSNKNAMRSFLIQALDTSQVTTEPGGISQPS